jgi:Tol biopolymer transport system component
LGDTVGESGEWSPDGKWLAYSNDRDLFVAKADGTEFRKLVTTSGPYAPVWSPDGAHLRFGDSGNNTTSLWEVSVDGKGLHRLLPDWQDRDWQCCGRWTADGRYFVFLSKNQVWALPQNGGFRRFSGVCQGK